MLVRTRSWPPIHDRVVLDVTTGVLSFNQHSTRLTTLQMRALVYLACRPGHIVTHTELFDAILYDDPDGGPETPRTTILYRLRLKLRPFPLTIQVHWGSRSELIEITP